jgi:putative spermidine/putrescine transport system ATP-binding protein
MVRLGNLGDRRPAQLSGGQQQRVAVARALIYEPELVLMDEPLGALDKQLREQMQLEIRHLHEDLGVTVVYVTHDQSEALTMSDRIAVFHQGIVQQLATPEELYERPANAFVASFIGENNRLDGRLASRDGSLCRVRVADAVEIVASIAVELPVGSPVALSIRPERIVVGDAGDGVNRFEARLEEVIYLGDHCKLRLALAGSRSFVAKLANTGAVPRLERGDAVSVSWRPECCLALPAHDGAASAESETRVSG